MPDFSNINKLLVKHLQGTLTVKEKKKLNAWINASPANEEFMRTRMKEDVITKNILALSKVDWDAQHERVLAMISVQQPKPELSIPVEKNRNIPWRSLAAAAIIIAFITMRHFYHPASKNVSAPWTLSYAGIFGDLQEMVTTTKLVLSKESAPPQKNFVPNGYEYNKSVEHNKLNVSLDSMPEGAQIQLGIWAIIKESERHIAFKKMNKPPDSTIKDSAYTRISIPKDSAAWQISLPDGSRAILAPGSSLAIFLHKSGDMRRQRILLLEGQATFDVSPNGVVPFLVETTRLKMTAHGTLFTISDFKREKTASVSLFNGKLDVENGKEIRKLNAAQKATIQSSSSDISIDTIGIVLQRLPWKSDYFDFSDQTLPVAIKTLAMWYGITKVKFGPGVDTITPGNLINGHLGKDLSLSEALDALNRDDLHFKSKDNTLFITK